MCWFLALWLEELGLLLLPLQVSEVVRQCPELAEVMVVDLVDLVDVWVVELVVLRRKLVVVL